MAGTYVLYNKKWRLPKAVFVKKSGVWNVCTGLYVKSNGSWRSMIETTTLYSGVVKNFNLWEYVGRPSKAISLILNIQSAITIQSNDTSGNRTPAFTVGNFNSNSSIVINNSGYISGGGGFGGKGGINPTKGSDGGYGITKGSNKNYDCIIVNKGTIAGGGGGGGGSSGYETNGGIGNQTTTGYWNGGDGAGITGFSKTTGQSIAPSSIDNSADGNGRGGDCGDDGQLGYTFGRGGKGAFGGKGRFAIRKSGLDIAEEGTILGGIG